MYGILHKEKQSQSVNPDGAELIGLPLSGTLAQDGHQYQCESERAWR